jgi:hypothetical protein
MAHQILVQFRGEGAGVGELSWAQRGIWRTIQRQGASETMGGIARLPDGVTVEHIAASLRYVMGRHQALRTRLTFDEHGHPRQEVHAAGEINLEVLDAGDADPESVAEDMRNRYESVDFDYAGEWPVRMGVVTKDGVATHSVAIYCHLSLDAHGLNVLIADLASMDPGTGTGGAPVTATQPLAQAHQQQTPAARRQNAAALRHWARVLRTASPRRFPDSTDRREPRWWGMSFHSPASALAMRAIAARHTTDTSPVLLAGYAVALARTVGNNPVVLQLAVSNRFRPGFADSVSPLAQASPCMVDIADVTFDEAVGRAWQAAMTTYLNSYYDPQARAELVERVNAERGEDIDLQCYFNDRRDVMGDPDTTTTTTPTSAEITVALSASVLTWGPHSSTPQPKLYLDVNDAEDGVEFTMMADTHFVAPADMEAIVRTLEAVVVDAALNPAATTGVTAAAVPAATATAAATATVTAERTLT